MGVGKYLKLKSLLSEKIVLVLLIFLVAFAFRFQNLGQMGQTWDEDAYIVDGYNLINLVGKADFQNPKWYSFPDHPPLAKYFYGITAHFDQDGILKNGRPSFRFDLNASRTLSALFGALSVLLLTLFGWRFFSKEVGILSGLILCFIPIYVGMTQLVTLESPIVLGFIASIYAFLLLLERPTNRKILLVSIILGATISIKITNLLLFPILLLSLIFWHKTQGKQMEKQKVLKILLVFPSSLLFFFLLWPALWFHPAETIHNMLSIRGTVSKVVPLFMGKYQQAPVYYYAVYFFLTTPLLLIGALIAGLKSIFQKPNYIYLTVVFWFLIPFLLSFYGLKQGGIRYIIEIYPALAIISALGIKFLATKFKEYGLIVLYFLIPAYLFVSCLLISPYYLNYFNLLAGGTMGVYQNRSFELESWGEGQREAVVYLIRNATRGSTVGVVVMPAYLLPPVDGLTFEFYNPKKSYDYLIVNYLALINAKSSYTAVPKDYELVYTVEAQGAPIVEVFKTKN